MHLHQAVLLDIDRQYGGKISPGEYELPFSFTIPSGAPPSFDGPGSLGEITYEVCDQLPGVIRAVLLFRLLCIDVNVLES
jgi:hypothetical protein